MADRASPYLNQLKETCKISGARWAAWVKRSQETWEVQLQHGLNKQRQAELSRFILNPRTATWLAGTFSSGRTRSRQTGDSAELLGCQRLFAFPNIHTHTTLIVGADVLNKTSENFFRVLSYTILPEAPPELRLEGENDEIPFSFTPFEIGLEVSYNLEDVLANVLEYMVGSVACDSALMSIRSGDHLRIAAAWNIPANALGKEVSIGEDEILSKIVTTRRGAIKDDIDSSETCLGLFQAQFPFSCLVIPVVIGKRVIGLFTFYSSQTGSFHPSDLRRVTLQSNRLAYVIENAIIFDEATRYLQQLALLNELASTASASSDMDEVTSRVVQRLRRAFHTDDVRIFLFAPDNRSLLEYRADSDEQALLPIPQENVLSGYVIQTGLPLRAGDIQARPELSVYLKDQSGSLSVLIVPLKYRGRIIGTLSLQSSEKNAFSQQDEQLLILIASHLVGLLENMRLNEETRERANNLNLIHQVIRQVVGLTDRKKIARVGAELMVREFGFDYCSIFLYDGAGHAKPGEEKLHYFSGAAEEIPSEVLGSVLNDGASRLVNNRSDVSSNALPARWRAGSEICVSLGEGEHIIGAIDVWRARPDAFNENDRLTLEALAGVLSSVILSARHYQQVQDSVRQLQAVRETALDIAGDLDLDALLKRVVHRARELVGARGAELGLLDENSQVIRVVVSDTPWYESQRSEIPLMAGVAGRVAAFNEPLVVSDYNSWSGRLFPEQEAPFKTVAGVPLKFQNKVMGTLTLMDDRPEWVFHDEDVQLLELLAPQVTVWIRNARLYQELQERIEAQHLAENRLIRSARLAAVGEMAAGVAHELNNPLTTVNGFVELVLEELAKDSPHRPDLELVLRESQRARSVVRRLLDFSRPVENQRVRTDINELVNDVLSLVHHLARTGGVTVRTSLAPDLPWISIDPNQIKQVLLNLVHNGIQAMPYGGFLDVLTAKKHQDEKEFVTISIQDYGEGISPENLVRIFEPFFTTRPAGKGTGLGLSVSYGIVNEHGGSIEVDSQVGKGSCFTILLPVESTQKNA